MVNEHERRVVSRWSATFGVFTALELGFRFCKLAEVSENVRLLGQSYDGNGRNDLEDVAGDDKDAETKLVRMLDRRLLPMIVLIFIMNYIDRTAITSARLRGLEADLNLTPFQYETVIAILYASYCPMQIPSNLLLNKASSPSLFIGGCVILWGAISGLTGLTRNFHDILICRFLIGIPEAAFYPGAIYLLSRWYTRKELAFRSAILYTGLLVSNAFGSLLAAGILAFAEGFAHITAWRWLFIIEGGLTICVGLATVYILPDYPHNTAWLTPEQRRLAQARLTIDAGVVDKDESGGPWWAGLDMALRDPVVGIFMLMTFTGLVGLSFSNFFPTIAATLGYSPTTTLLLAAPPWIVASVLCLLNARHADATGERFFHISTWLWAVMVGFTLSLSSMHFAVRYIALFFLASGYAGFSLMLVWVSNTVSRPPSKRAAAIALVNGFGNLGNVLGSYTWKAKWGPAYRTSMLIGLVALACTTILAWILRHIFIRMNSRLDSEEQQDVAEPQETAQIRTDSFKQPSFRYLY